MRARGFTLVEIVMVGALLSVVVALGVAALSSVATRERKFAGLKQVYSELQSLRAQHLGAAGDALSCMAIDVIDPLNWTTDEQTACGTVVGAVPMPWRYALTVSSDPFCLDNMARAVTCADVTIMITVDIVIDVDGDGAGDGTVTWGADGRLSADFPFDDNPAADVRGQLHNVGAVYTPVPTAVGGYTGRTTSPTLVLQ